MLPIALMQPAQKILPDMEHDESLSALYAYLLKHGMPGAAEPMRLLVDEASKAERTHHLCAAPYQRNYIRSDHANGFKKRKISTCFGEITFAVPTVRKGDFYPAALDKAARSEARLALALADMYVQGVTRAKVGDIIAYLVGPKVSIRGADIDRSTMLLGVAVARWNDMPIGETPYLILDAYRLPITHDGATGATTVLTAVGIDADGERSALGTLTTADIADGWQQFLASLIDRGLCGVRYVISDDYADLHPAREAALPEAIWQRCSSQLGKPAQGTLPRQPRSPNRTWLARIAPKIFHADKSEAGEILDRAITRWRSDHPALSTWVETGTSEGLQMFLRSTAQRTHLQTSGAAAIQAHQQMRAAAPSVDEER